MKFISFYISILIFFNSITSHAMDSEINLKNPIFENYSFMEKYLPNNEFPLHPLAKFSIEESPIWYDYFDANKAELKLLTYIILRDEFFFESIEDMDERSTYNTDNDFIMTIAGPFAKLINENFYIGIDILDRNNLLLHPFTTAVSFNILLKNQAQNDFLFNICDKFLSTAKKAGILGITIDLNMNPFFFSNLNNEEINHIEEQFRIWLRNATEKQIKDIVNVLCFDSHKTLINMKEFLKTNNDQDDNNFLLALNDFYQTIEITSQNLSSTILQYHHENNTEAIFYDQDDIIASLNNFLIPYDFIRQYFQHHHNIEINESMMPFDLLIDEGNLYKYILLKHIRHFSNDQIIILVDTLVENYFDIIFSWVSPYAEDIERLIFIWFNSNVKDLANIDFDQTTCIISDDMFMKLFNDISMLSNLLDQAYMHFINVDNNTFDLRSLTNKPFYDIMSFTKSIRGFIDCCEEFQVNETDDFNKENLIYLLDICEQNLTNIENLVATFEESIETL